MGNGHISQRRKYNTFTPPSSSLLAPIRPFAPSSAHSFSSFSPEDFQTSPEHPKGFSHSLERMTIHRPDTEVVPQNGTEHVATAETTNPSPRQLASDTEAVAEQDQPTQTAQGVTSPATSSASALQRMAVSAGDPVPPPPRVNRQGGTKRSGWSLERMAITREQLAPAQRYATGVSEASEPAPQAEVLQKKNTTGLPDHLKAGIESLSGLSLDDVHVHYNSPKPAGVDALAYTQGTDIHMGMGQEKHLAHEAWHVVQQKEGRVQPTLQAKGVAINDDRGLEREADVMGRKASNLTSGQMLPISPTQKRGITSTGSIQRMIGFEYQLTHSFITPTAGGALTKGEVIGAKQDGVTPTVDINQQGGYELEFISDVFDEVNATGWRNLKNAVSKTRNMVEHVHQATGDTTRPVSEVLTDGINDYDILVMDQVGILHITAGIQLDRLQTFLTDFSNKNDPAIPIPNEPLGNIVPDAVNRGTPVLTQIETQQGVHFSDPLKREIFSLVSLLASIMRYLDAQTVYFKALYRLLNRTDMSTIVLYVRDRIDQEFADRSQPVPNPHPLLTVIEASLPDAPYLDQPLVPHKPWIGVTNLDWYSSLISPLSLGRRAWLQQLFNGNDPLSVAWLNQQATAGVAGAQTTANIVESVGHLGNHTDPSRSSIRPIFEIRNLRPIHDTRELEEWALGVSRFIKAINEGRDQPLVLEGRRGNDITRFFSQLFHR